MDSERKLLLLATLAWGLFISPFATGEAGSQPQTEGPPSSFIVGAEARILAVPLKSFMVENANMAEALLALRSADVDHIVIGFERIPHREGEEGGSLSLSIRDGTVGEIVKRLCEEDPRYEYQVIEGSMIEVRPVGAITDPEDLLNVTMQNYKVDSNITAPAAIERVNQDVPEMREFLNRKAKEWLEKTGRPPGGAPGSMVSGNMVPPRFTLELHNVTVRQILDAISLKSIQMFNGEEKFTSDGRQAVWSPTGWKYDFVIDPDARTGLGGYPKWTRF